MLRVAIVEDEKEYRDLLQEMLARFASEQSREIQVTAFSDGSKLVADYKKEFDIILLDIEMPSLNGMEAAKKIRIIDEDVVLVFITNMALYAIKGYEVDAFDFVLKPITYYTFSMRFARAVSRVRARGTKQICISLPDGIKKLDCRQIHYVEIQNRMLYYHTSEGCFGVRGTLKRVQEELEDFHFIKCNHWYLVNLRHVSEIHGNKVVVAGDELEISRRSRNTFLAAVTDFMGENI